MSAMNGISNADSYLGWDTTTPNSTNHYRLKQILKSAIMKASNFGIYVVTRHNDCGRRGHSKKTDTYGYICTDTYDMNITYRDPRFVWGGDQLFQGARYELCPCAKTDEHVDHHIIEDIIHSPDTDASLYRSIANVLRDIQSAIEAAGDKQPRSGIREYLLRALLVLNDAIMPTSVEEHIKASALHS